MTDIHFLQDEDFDPHFKIFHKLMPFRVVNILLVSSPYDAYIMEEDGSLATRIINEYTVLNLTNPPQITRVPTAQHALTILAKNSFDLVIVMPRLGSMGACSFNAKVKKINPELPVILLAHSDKDAEISNKSSYGGCTDGSFTWCCDSNLLLSIIKSVEDWINVEHDTKFAMVKVILLVEDSPMHRSSLLPMLYNEVVNQTQSVLDEGLNEQHRLLKMRARPKILIATTYEEAMTLFNMYRQYICAVMSDVRFPKAGKTMADAGIELINKFRQEIPDLPCLILSAELDNKNIAKKNSILFVNKYSYTIKKQLHDFFLKYLWFGDFIFRTADGKKVGKASSLAELEREIHKIPLESLIYHIKNNHFFHWVMARSEISLASRLERQHCYDKDYTKYLREDIITRLHALRQIRQKGIVQQFNKKFFDPDVTDFACIGSGSMGGKARGIAFIASRLKRVSNNYKIFKEVSIRIPQTCVIATSGFDDFIRENKLQELIDKSDSVIKEAFLKAVLPNWLVDDLRALLIKVNWPIAIRSSSMLEDAQSRPYAGLYDTFMLKNNNSNFNTRLAELFKTIKLIYASTWFENPRSYSKSIGQVKEDSMAVIIQQLAGNNYGDYYYPAISGVVQSYNYYPFGNIKSEDCVAYLAVGFGLTVVNGEQSLRFSPEHPHNMPQFSTVEDMLENTQRNFYSLSMGKGGNGQILLKRRNINDATNEDPIWKLSSTYIAEENRVADADLSGIKIMTFASILKYKTYPLSEILAILAKIGKEGMGCEIEIEFAVDMNDENNFYFLQIRPMVTSNESFAVEITDNDRRNAFLCSNNSLGHGLFSNIYDIIFVKPTTFDISKTREMAQEIGEINKIIHGEKRKFLLIGPGRFGTADPWLGIPVMWSDISAVGAIAELCGYGLNFEPSQGSHFFQNITSLDIPYMIINEDNSMLSDKINWSWLEKQEVAVDKEYITHVKMAKSIMIKIDGRHNEAVCLQTT